MHRFCIFLIVAGTQADGLGPLIAGIVARRNVSPDDWSWEIGPEGAGHLATVRFANKADRDRVFDTGVAALRGLSSNVWRAESPLPEGSDA